ncbi:hypothetical protein ABKN59_001562 [Abortiporus biennis]
MLLKLTSSDIENTTIVDCSTGTVLYQTHTPSTASSSRSRSQSTSSLRTISSIGSTLSTLSSEKLTQAQKVTYLFDQTGDAVAEIVWEERHASLIRIREEEIAGTAELFDASFVKVLPDETLIPTRMEYTWRTTPDSLTLLDDDRIVIAELYSDCSSEELTPALIPGSGQDYLDLEERSPDEMPEILVTFILMHTLRERMYSITKYVYGQQFAQQNKHQSSFLRTPLRRLRRGATRSIANLRDSFRRTVS